MDELREHGLAVARRAVFEAHRRTGASAWIRGSGGSMRPLIAPGDWLHVEFGAVPSRLGEIVVFAAGDVLVAHRLVERVGTREQALLVTKGDAQPACDPPLAPGDVLGVVRARRSARGGRATTIGCDGLGARLLALRSLWRARAQRPTTVIARLIAQTLSKGGRG